MTIEVNYAVLTDSANALRRIAGEFNDAVTIKDHYGKAMGAGSIERALGTFGGNWDRHAKDLVERLLHALETRVHEVRVTGRLTESMLDSALALLAWPDTVAE